MIKTKVSKTFKDKDRHHFYLLQKRHQSTLYFCRLVVLFLFWSSSIYIYIISTTCILSLFGIICPFRWYTITTRYNKIDSWTVGWGRSGRINNIGWRIKRWLPWFVSLVNYFLMLCSTLGSYGSRIFFDFLSCCLINFGILKVFFAILFFLFFLTSSLTKF